MRTQPNVVCSVQAISSKLIGFARGFCFRQACLVTAAAFLLLLLMGTAPSAQAAPAQPSCPSGNVCSAHFLVPPPQGSAPDAGWLVETITVLGPCANMYALDSVTGCFAFGGAPPSFTGTPYSPAPLHVTGLVPLPGDIANINIPASLVTEARHAVATLRGIPDDARNVYWSRGEIRAYLFLRLLQIANLTRPLTADEQAAADGIAADIIDEQTAIAREAQFLFAQWSHNPCAFILPPGAGGDPNAYVNDPGTFAYCQPKAGFAILQNAPEPSAAEFTAWAQGARLAGRIAAWGQQTYAFTSPTPADGTAQGTAEYGNVFAGIHEGLGFLTSQHAAIATIDASTETTEQADLNEIWLDGLKDVAKDRAYESVGKEISAVVNLFIPETEAVGEELAQELALELGEASVENFETGVGLVIAGAVVTALGLWQDINNLQVPIDLQTSVTCAIAYNSGCTGSTTSPTRATLHDYAQDTGGRQLILEALVRSTMPDYLASRSTDPNYGIVPAPGPVAPTDPRFSIVSLGNTTGTISNTFNSLDYWTGSTSTTSIANGWLVQSQVPSGSNNQGPLLRTPVLNYQTAGAVCVDQACSNIRAINPEIWRAWLDGYNFHSQRIAVIAGTGSVTNPRNACPGFLDPTGCGIQLGNVCVQFSGSPTIQINVGDRISVDSAEQTVSRVTTSNGNTYVQTSGPFPDTTQDEPVLLMANAYGDCQTSGVSALGSRVSGPDCVTSPTISTYFGMVSIVVPPPTISKAFSPTSIAVGGTSTLSLTITNPNTGVPLAGVAFSDTLPARVQVAATPNVSNACGGTVSATAGGGVISLSGGSIAASGSCTISVDVTATSAGAKNNTTGAVSSTNGGTGATSNTATLTVTANALTALSPAKVWIGLKNGDDVGLRVDLRAQVFVKVGASETMVGSGDLLNQPTGSSGFDRAIHYAIPLNLTGGSANLPAGAALEVRVSVRRTCSGLGHNSGTVRLWYNGQKIDSGAARDAGSRFDATISGQTNDYFLRTGLALSKSAGSPRTSVDAFVNSAVSCALIPNGRPFTSFGTWVTP